MKKVSLLPVLILSQLICSEGASHQLKSNSTHFSMEWSEDFTLDDEGEIEAEEGEDIPSKDLSKDDEEYDFLAEVDFELEEWEIEGAPKKKIPVEDEILFTSSGGTHKKPIQTVPEEVAITEIPKTHPVQVKEVSQ